MKNKKVLIGVVSAAVVLIAAVVGILILKNQNQDPGALQSGSFINSYDYIQGDFNKDNLNEVSKAFLEKIDIKYGKETQIDESNKTVETIVRVPDIVKIYEAAFDELKEDDKSDYMTASDSLKKIVQEKLADNAFEVIENSTTLTMVKEGGQWYIVPDENFGTALAGSMVDFLDQNMDDIK